MYLHNKKILSAGPPLKDAEKVIIMLHGRGARAENIISLASQLSLGNVSILAPQATNNSWYPYSFLAPEQENQPALNSALELLGSLVEDVKNAGIGLDKLYFLGFSQGACLSLEYVTKNARRFGGVVAFTGGLIGQELTAANYSGDFMQTPFLITTGNPDPHVPLARVQESVEIITNMNGKVSLKVYDGRAHTIGADEINLANQLVFA